MCQIDTMFQYFTMVKYSRSTNLLFMILDNRFGSKQDLVKFIIVVNLNCNLIERLHKEHNENSYVNVFKCSTMKTLMIPREKLNSNGFFISKLCNFIGS